MQQHILLHEHKIHEHLHIVAKFSKLCLFIFRALDEVIRNVHKKWYTSKLKNTV